MSEFFAESVFLGVFLTVGASLIGSFIKKKLKLAVFHPVLIAVVLIIVFMKLTGLSYEAYSAGTKLISYLLTPATVCLAIPLYEQVEVLRKNPLAILAGVFAGMVTSLTTVLLLCLLFRLDHTTYVTLLPKSVTTAIGLGLSEEMGGFGAVTAAVIICTGIFGNISAEAVLKLFRINDPVARGIAIGSASHAIGTTKAIELGPVEGAMSSLSIALSGIFTVVGVMVFERLL